jgi:hypothetical protein
LLDGFKLSYSKLMRNLQIIFFSLFILYIFIKLFSKDPSHSLFNSIHCDTIDDGSRPSTPEGSRPTTPTPTDGNKGKGG